MHVWAKPQKVAEWEINDLANNDLHLKVDLSEKINVPGQYILSVVPEGKEQFEISNADIFYNGSKAMKEFITIEGYKIHVNQTAQITSKNNLLVVLTIHFDEPCKGNIEFTPELIH